MEIKSTFKNRFGQVLDYVYYEEADPMKNLDGKVLHGVHGFCFYGDKLIIVYSEKKKSWGLPGGGIESGETIEKALVREIKEETNMKVLYQELIGFVDINEPERVTRITRSFCMVEPYGDFIADDDVEGDVTEIKLIDPGDYKKYFDWGVIGEHIMKKAVELKNKMIVYNHGK